MENCCLIGYEVVSLHPKINHMAKNKEKVQEATKYIAFDNENDTIIHIGSLDQVAKAVTDHCGSEGWDPEDIEDYVLIYKLGEEVNYGVETKVEIYF